MPFAFVVSAAPVSGTLVTAAQGVFKGIGPSRLYVTNDGAEALTAAKVQLGPDLDNLYDYDTTTFASLAAGGTLAILIPSPINAIRVLATCVAGTTVSVWLADEARQQG